MYIIMNLSSFFTRFARKETFNSQLRNDVEDYIKSVRFGEEENKTTYVVNKPFTSLIEQFTGIVPQVEVQFPRELGEQHPFDFKVTEILYKKYGLVTGIVDKYIDFIIGGGYFTVSDDENAKAIIDNFIIDTDFDSQLRVWVKDALVKGAGFLELGGGKNEVPQGLKLLDAKFMYIDRDEYGTLKGYNQYIGHFDKFKIHEVVPFEPFQVAHIAFNKVADAAYGLGIVFTNLSIIESQMALSHDMNLLMERKANSPYHVKMGNEKSGAAPTQEQVDAFKQKLVWLKNNHEWVTDQNVDIKAIDFGNIGDKFTKPMEHNMEMMSFAFQVPMVLFGKANVNQGNAKVQMEAFKRRVKSFQEEIEKVIEKQIFSRVLRAQGFNSHVELEWGIPSDDEKNERIDRINETLKNSMLNIELRIKLEQELAELFNIEELKETPEEERKREEERQQPIVPGSNRRTKREIIYDGELIWE